MQKLEFLLKLSKTIQMQKEKALLLVYFTI